MPDFVTSFLAIKTAVFGQTRFALPLFCTAYHSKLAFYWDQMTELTQTEAKVAMDASGASAAGAVTDTTSSAGAKVVSAVGETKTATVGADAAAAKKKRLGEFRLCP